MLKDVAWRDSSLSVALPIDEGYFVLPDRPGLGFDLDETVLCWSTRACGRRRVGRTFYV